MFEEKAAKWADAAERNCQEAAKKKQISATATDCQGSAKNKMIYRGLVTKSTSCTEETAQSDQGEETGTAGVTPTSVV